jgi:hypothetical protein
MNYPTTLRSTSRIFEMKVDAHKSGELKKVGYPLTGCHLVGPAKFILAPGHQEPLMARTESHMIADDKPRQ